MPPELQQANDRFKELESIIQRGKKTFIEVGRALAEIRDNEHWLREGYKSFAEYCETRWGWKKAYCSQLISATEAVDALPESKKFAIANEQQARALRQVTPSNREAVLDAAIERGPVTAKSIREVAAEIEQPEPPRVHSSDEVQCEPEAEELETVRPDPTKETDFYSNRLKDVAGRIIDECVAKGTREQWKAVQKQLTTFWAKRKF